MLRRLSGLLLAVAALLQTFATGEIPKASKLVSVNVVPGLGQPTILASDAKQEKLGVLLLNLGGPETLKVRL